MQNQPIQALKLTDFPWDSIGIPSLNKDMLPHIHISFIQIEI